ncbi:MAG: hypothetical protein ACFFFG_07235 [Candidatus Thorarchaeota archaeon]
MKPEIVLDTLLESAGIVSEGQRIKLLCAPDYIFFRTHSHMLYREFRGIPKYSIITRKITEKSYNWKTTPKECSLKSLYIIDGSTGLKTAPFFFQLASHLRISIVGSNINFFVLPRLRFESASNPKLVFKPYHPYYLISSHLHRHKPVDDRGLETKAVILPPSSQLFLEEENSVPPKNAIAIGATGDVSDFFPTSFDILRVNLGDLIEYDQHLDLGANLREQILNKLELLISAFNIPCVLVSVYKIAKFLNSLGGKSSVASQMARVQEICNSWRFSEVLLVNNEKRRIWDLISLHTLPEVYDKYAYLVFFNPSK